MGIKFAPECNECGAIFVDGSKTTCSRCLRLRGKKRKRRRLDIRFKCDCGEMAVAVILVKIGPEDDVREERIAVCEGCLEEETETQAWLDLLGVSHEGMTVRGRKARDPYGKRRN